MQTKEKKLPKRAKVVELMEILDRTEKVVRQYIREVDGKPDENHRYLVAPMLEKKKEKETRTLHPQVATTDLGRPVTWADKLKEKQIEKIQVQIDQLRGDLWEKTLVLSSLSEYNASIRASVENFRQRKIAADGTPEGKERIENLCDTLLNEIVEELNQ